MRNVGMNRIVTAALAIGLALSMTACSGGSSSSSESVVSLPNEPEIIVLPEDSTEPEITVSVDSFSEVDPRLKYTRCVISLIDKIAEDPESVVCSEELKAQLLENPEVIPELHEEHNYFVYSMAQQSDSTQVSVTVAYYSGATLMTDLIHFNNSDGVITITDIDELLVFLSGGAYVV